VMQNLARRRRTKKSPRAALGTAVLAVYFAVSCSLSPIEDLPSATDGFNVDGPLDLDGIADGSGGSSAASGGAPQCSSDPPTYQCRGVELWEVRTPSNCAGGQQLVEVCAEGCLAAQAGLAMCALGFGGFGGYGGSTAGAASSQDDGVP